MVRLSLAAALIATALALPVHAEVLFHTDFEDGTINASVGTSRAETVAGSNSGGTIEAVANPLSDSGNSSAFVGRCSIPQGYRRAEFSGQRLPTQGQVRRYRWSYLLLDDFFDNRAIRRGRCRMPVATTPATPRAYRACRPSITSSAGMRRASLVNSRWEDMTAYVPPSWCSDHCGT